MTTIRIINQGKTNDFNKFEDVNDRMYRHVQATETGSVSECYGDPTTGKVVYVDEFADADTFVAHFANIAEAGYVEELLACFEIECLMLLSPTDDPRVLDLMKQFSGSRMKHIVDVGLARPK